MRMIDQINFLDLSFDVWEEDGAYYFLARDIAEVLYAKHSDSTHHMLELLSSRNISTFEVEASGQTSSMKFINREGLYETLAYSSLPQAKIWREIAFGKQIELLTATEWMSNPN